MVIRSKRANEKIAEKKPEEQIEDQTDWIDKFYGIDGQIIDEKYDDEDYDFFCGVPRILDDGSGFW